MSGRGAVWLARYLGVVEVAGSSPVAPTMLHLLSLDQLTIVVYVSSSLYPIP